jgi:preprotein translocase subunit SecF
MTNEILHPAEPKAGTHSSFLIRLTTGTGAFDILGKRRTYYLVSTVLVVISLLLIFIRGFNFGIDFSGGTRIQMPVTNGATIEEVAKVVADTAGVDEPTVQILGSGGAATVQVRTASLTTDQVAAAKAGLAERFGISSDQVSDSAVSETWGSEISQQAIIALIVFLIAVGIFLWLRYERRVAFGALIAVLHDIVITAGLYSLIGFEVTPATVIGLLAILGFSLYDTVVVYDKVQENTKGLTSLLRRNYREAANLAVNQTLMRSINTTVIALLPVGGLLIAGVAILGSGTLKDLALVQLIGMLVSGYSSVFLAVPVAVDLRERDPIIVAHTARVAAKRKADGILVDADGDPIGRVPGASKPLSSPDQEPVGTAPSTKPRAGVRPSGKAGRPTGKRAR